MLLAREGLQVTLLEKSDAVGGRTRTVTPEGFRFDLGPTFFLYPQILESVFERCGLSLRDYVTMKRVDPSYRLAFEGGPDVRIGGDLDNLEMEIARLDAGDARNIRRFIEANRTKLRDFTPILQRPFLNLVDYLAPSVVKALRHLAPPASVDADLTRYFRDPRVRLAFSFQTKYLGMSPFRCPSLFTFLAFLEYEFGVWHPLGGCGAVSEGMAAAARDLGVDIRLGEAVETVEFEGRRATGVRTAKGLVPADAVVIGADFATAIRTMVPNTLRRRWSDERIDAKSYSCSTYMLYLGVEGLYPTDHHSIFLSSRYEENIRQIEEAAAPPTQPSIYVANPGVTDPAFAADGRSSLYVLAPVGHCGKIDWSKESEPFRNLVLDRLEAFGFDGLRDRIRFEKRVTPEDWRDDMNLHLGATFNLSHGLDQMLYFRPHNRFEDVDGLYLVGGGTHPGSGLPVIYEGARITTDLVLKDLGLARAPVTEWAPATTSPAAEALA